MIDELQSDDIKRRAFKGAASLLVRQLVVRLAGFFGMLVLARALSPEIFGVFAIAQFCVLFFEQFSSLGLSAALLRKKASPTAAELSTVFTLQQAIVAAIVTAALLGAPAITGYFGFADDHLWLIRAMACALLLASLKTIPTILLERNLRHDLVATSEVAEFVTYQATAIVLALHGFGIWALVAAVLARGVVGVTVLHLFSSWRPRFAFDRHALSEILRFGVPVQMANFAGMGTSAVVPVLVGSVLGAPAVGYANFSRSIADALLFQPLIIMGRVQFRVFGSMQDEAGRLARAVERSVYAGSILTFLAAALVVSQARPFIDFVVTSKWSAALPLLYVLAPAYLLYAVAQPLMQALKALGDAKTPLHGVLLQGAIQIAVFLGLAPYAGLSAYAAGLTLGLMVATWLALTRLRRHVELRVWAQVRSPLISAFVAVSAALAVNLLAGTAAAAVVSVALCISLYLTLMGLLDGRRLGAELSGFATTLLPNSAFVRGSMRGISGALLRLHDVTRRVAHDGVGK